MTTIFKEIDLHVIVILLMLLVLAIMLPHWPWVLIVLAVVPQGRILTRALIDYPSFKRPAGGYLIANEIAVALSVAACLGVWRFFSKT